MINILKTAGDLINGKKTMIASVVGVVALVWSLMSPATAPSEAALMRAVEQGQDVVQVVQAREENPLPKIIALTAAVAALLSGMHKDSKLGRAIWMVGQLAERYVDMTDLNKPKEFVEKVKRTG